MSFGEILRRAGAAGFALPAPGSAAETPAKSLLPEIRNVLRKAERSGPTR
jgi:hypothetical protein